MLWKDLGDALERLANRASIMTPAVACALILNKQPVYVTHSVV